MSRGRWGGWGVGWRYRQPSQGSRQPPAPPRSSRGAGRPVGRFHILPHQKQLPARSQKIAERALGWAIISRMGDHFARSLPTSELPFLSPAEWRIFALLSKKGPLTVRQLVAELAEDDSASRSYTTILTLAQRLVAKNYLSEGPKAARRGPASAITYSTSVSHAEALRYHTERFLTQYTSGDHDDLLCVRQVVDQYLSST